MKEKMDSLPVKPIYGGEGEGTRPLICLSLNARFREQMIDRIVAQGWRPVDPSITGQEQMLALKPVMGLVDDRVEVSFCDALRRQGCHIVKWSGMPFDEHEWMSIIHPDHDAIGRLAVDHFAERGFKKMVFFRWDKADELEDVYEGARKQGRKSAVAVTQYKVSTVAEGGWWNRYKSHADEFRAWLSEIGTPVGIFASDDRLAALFCMYCQDIGVDVPVDVAVLGIGNRPSICQCTPTPISTIDMDKPQVVDLIIALLARGLNGGAVKPRHVRYPPRGIILRESTDVLASVDRNVAKALRFIWVNYRKNLSIDDIAEGVGMRRFQLERAFKKELKSRVGEELRRKRMEVFVQLLLSTDAPIEDICCQSGFFSRAHLFRMFKREFGTTPMRYRSKNA